MAVNERNEHNKSDGCNEHLLYEAGAALLRAEAAAFASLRAEAEAISLDGSRLAELQAAVSVGAAVPERAGWWRGITWRSLAGAMVLAVLLLGLAAYALDPLAEAAGLQVTAELCRTLEEHGADSAMVPKWLPNGYQQESIDVWQGEGMTVYTAVYAKRDLRLTVQLRQLEAESQVDLGQIKERLGGVSSSDKRKKDGQVYYVLRKRGVDFIVWSEGCWECSVAGYFLSEHIDDIIESVGG